MEARRIGYLSYNPLKDIPITHTKKPCFPSLSIHPFYSLSTLHPQFQATSKSVSIDVAILDISYNGLVQYMTLVPGFFH